MNNMKSKYWEIDSPCIKKPLFRPGNVYSDIFRSMGQSPIREGVLFRLVERTLGRVFELSDERMYRWYYLE